MALRQKHPCPQPPLRQHPPSWQWGSGSGIRHLCHSPIPCRNTQKCSSWNICLHHRMPGSVDVSGLQSTTPNAASSRSGRCSQAFPERGQNRAPSSRAAGMGHLRRDNKGDRPQQGHGLAPLASSVGPCRADTDTCGHCSPRCAFGGSKAREGECAKMRVGPSSAPSSSPGSMSALPHPRKCPGCGQQLWELPLSPHW